MKVLFLTSDGQDNLEDSLLHGLRSLLGQDCIDFPKKEVMYQGYSGRAPEQCYGRLFTLWRSLLDSPIDRFDIERRLNRREFDLVVIGSIHRTFSRYAHLMELLSSTRTVVVDGEDHGALAVQALRFLYFKRELSWKARLVWYSATRARWFRIPVPTAPLRIEPISFSIPATKILADPLPASRRTRLFPRQIVDEEVQALVSMGPVALSGSPQTLSAARGYVYASEEEYYADLQTSLFGITTKRAGWDALRHYEIAANGGILCFRNLLAKPGRCAPVGLSEANTLVYNSGTDLVARTNGLSLGEKDSLIEAAHSWARSQTTQAKAEYFIDVVRRRLR